MADETFTLEQVKRLATATKFIVAGILYAADNRKTNDEPIETGISIWANLAESINTDENWKDGKHFGYCTKETVICNRCAYSEYLDRAEHTLDVATDQLYSQIGTLI